VNVYSKARELADAILASEESLRLADARALDKEGYISEKEFNNAVHDFNTLVIEVMEILHMSIGLSSKCGNCGCACKEV